MDEFSAQPTPASTAGALVEVAHADNGGNTAQQIFQRGGLPLLVGGSILAEISDGELVAGTAAARELSDTELSIICGELAARLQDTLSSGEPTADLVETASDAATLFVLCLQQNGIAASSTIGPCSVHYDAASCVLELKQPA